MTSDRPLVKLRTQCPYCDHLSPVDSKFCNECGAALHLRPCPHCGAVNDLTTTSVCARGGGARETREPPEPPSDEAAASADGPAELDLSSVLAADAAVNDASLQPFHPASLRPP